MYEEAVNAYPPRMGLIFGRRKKVGKNTTANVQQARRLGVQEGGATLGEQPR